MDLGQKKALLEASLERAADTLGDVTPHVLKLYYERHPDARQSFETAPGGRAKVEREMVDQALYCLMTWFDAPMEIEIILLEAVPHHLDVLKIPPHLFSELILAVCDVISARITSGETEAHAVWGELAAAMKALVEKSACHARTARPAAI